MNGDGPLVRVENLGKDFREGFLLRRKTVLDGVSFITEPGRLYGFLGPNGAGKSTTIHVLMGFLSPSRGRVELFGRSPGDSHSRERVGFLPEVFAFDAFTTGMKLLLRFDALSGRPLEGREVRARAALEAVGLEEAAHRRVGTYSKGMTQRIGLAQALLGDPDLLILDEPMSGMDPATRRATRELLCSRRASGNTTFFSTHILSDVEALADDLIVLDRGRVVAHGALRDLLGPPGASVVVFGDERPERFTPLFGKLGLSAESADGRVRVRVPDDRTKSLLVAGLASEGADIMSVAPEGGGLESLFLRLTAEAAEFGEEPPPGKSAS